MTIPPGPRSQRKSTRRRMDEHQVRPGVWIERVRSATDRQRIVGYRVTALLTASAFVAQDLGTVSSPCAARTIIRQALGGRA